MKRTIMYGLIFTGVIALANGCSSKSSTAEQQRDYHEYAGLRAGQPGSGDSLGRGIYANSDSRGRGTYVNSATDGEMNGDVQVSARPTASRQAAPRRVSPSYVPRRQDVAGVPQD
jgi:hypothetical protein